MSILPPPAELVTGPPWRQSRSAIGIDFPEDYREFVDRYGAGELEVPDALGLSIYAPCSAPGSFGDPVGFEGFMGHTLEISPLFEGWGAVEWGGMDYRLSPSPGGLLTWGESDLGDVFWWHTVDSDPNAWPVVMWARGPAATYRFDMGMVELLQAMLTGDPRFLSTDWSRSPDTHWTMTSDWVRRGVNISAGPAGKS